LLLDTHVYLHVLGQTSTGMPRAVLEVLQSAGTLRIVSVASLWEIAIKARSGKLPISFPLQGLASRTEALGFRVLDIGPEHALTDVAPMPETADPFDRLLLAIAKVEGAALLTIDAKLRDHPLAWRSGSA